MRNAYASCAVLAVILLSGCVAQQPKKEVRLSELISGLRAELLKARKECEANKELCNNSLYLSESSITLSVAGSTTSTFSVGVPVGPVKFGGESSDSSNVTNTITLKLNNPSFVGKNSFFCMKEDGGLDGVCIKKLLDNALPSYIN